MGSMYCSSMAMRFILVNFVNSYVIDCFIYNIYDIFCYFLYMTSLVLLDALANVHFAPFEFLQLRRCMGYACTL